MNEISGADRVSQDMFAILYGQETPLLTRWTFQADDPFAVMMSISRPSGRWIDWLMSRDLLVEGLNHPAGIGDVRLTPFRDEEFDVVEIRIGDEEGFAALEFDRDLLERFLDATYEIVPAGAEASMINIEAELSKVTNSLFG